MCFDSDKTSECFFYWYLLFSYQVFRFLVPRGIDSQASSKSCICSVSTPHKTRMFTVRLTGNGHGFAVTVLAIAMPLDHPMRGC